MKGVRAHSRVCSAGDADPARSLAPFRLLHFLSLVHRGDEPCESFCLSSLPSVFYRILTQVVPLVALVGFVPFIASDLGAPPIVNILKAV